MKTWLGELTRAERIHGREHDAVADALSSLTIVRDRAGEHELAAARRARAADIYVAPAALP